MAESQILNGKNHGGMNISNGYVDLPMRRAERFISVQMMMVLSLAFKTVRNLWKIFPTK